MIEDLDHIQMAMPQGSEEVARAFWTSLLGLKEIEKPKALQPQGGVWFVLGAGALHLGVEEPFRPAKKAHPCLTVKDLDSIAERLTEEGRPVEWSAPLNGRRRFFTEDPFGNRLEFTEKEPT